jgi:hypothetical protein
MSTEQDTRRVSETYRDIAKETSPAKLDDKVMAMASQEARTRYGMARAWIRPVAWAATIGLSFAFILEMTYFSDDAPPVDAGSPARTDSDAGRAAEPASQAPAFKRAPAAILAAPEITADEMPALREAEERAYRQLANTVEHCEAEDRKDADSWYRCVLALREQGLEEAASAELDALREAFPDFREPVPE